MHKMTHTTPSSIKKFAGLKYCCEIRAINVRELQTPQRTKCLCDKENHTGPAASQTAGFLNWDCASEGHLGSAGKCVPF